MIDKIDINSPEITSKVTVIKILGHPIRYSIALILNANGVMNVGSIQEALDLPQSTVSQHISKMRESGIVEAQRDGTKIYYTLVDPTAIDVVKSLEK